MKKVVYTFCFYLLCSPALAQNLLEEGKKLFNAEQYNEAEKIFEQVLTSDSENAEANYFMGRIYLNLSDYDKSKDYLEKAVKLDEGNIDYHLWLANVYRGKTRSASFLSAAQWAGKWKSELERAFEIDAKNIEARKQLINYYLNAPAIGGGDKEKGKRLAQETIEIDEIQGRLLLAYAYKQTNKIDLSIAEYRKALALNPKIGSAYNSLGYIFLKQKDYDNAELNFKKYVEVAPDDPNAYDSLGEYYAERGRTDEAITQYQKALAIDPKFSPSRFKLAQAYEQKQMKEDAIQHYQALIELTPADARAKDAEKRLKNLQE